MGEEEKKTVEKKQAAIEDAGKKGDQLGQKVEKKEEDKNPDKNKNQKKEDQKAAGSGEDDSKDAKEQDPPPSPQEIVLKVYMHCEGCARKVRRSLQGFYGVEDVITDCKSQKVVVKGEKADPLKVLARVQKKSHRQVELLSPVPKPQPEEPPKKEEPLPHHHQAEEKKEEPQVITAVLKVHMHCEACSQEIKKRILRMKGVESAEADLKSSQVSVKGVFEAQKLVNYLYKRTGKHAAIVKQDLPEKKEKDQKAEDGKEEEKAEEGGRDEKKAADQKESKENSKESSSGAAAANKAEEEATMEENAKVVETKRSEYYYYPAMYPTKYAASGPGDLHSSANTTSTYSSSYQYYQPAAYPPQLFSDENPNACSIM